jgi:ABC-type uncharacterized transport system ATPase subunit
VSAPTLSLTGIRKRYGHVRALDDVSLTVRPGTIHALLGENGAGKTTLMRVAFGMLRPDTGDVRLDGRDVRLRSPVDAIAAGIGMVHQHFTLVPAMTVAENLALGGHGRLRRAENARLVDEIAALTGFVLDPAARVETLSVGAQQRVEIAKALARTARILVLDEPTAVLAPVDAEELLRWLRTFAAAGNSAVLITHKLREALSVADDVTVLRHGRVTYAGPAHDASVASLTRAMIGDAPGLTFGDSSPTTRHSTGAIVFRAERLTVRDERGLHRVRDASFVVRSGEIVGLAGVEGTGHRELLRALAARREPAGGTLERPAAIGFIPEDRHHEAVLLDRSLAENIALRGAGSRRGQIGWPAVRAHTQALLRRYDVRAPSALTQMRTLSGGNQQKLVLARELDDDAHLDGPWGIVAENPTRGLDILAAADVHARLRAARDGGAAVVIYSSDLDEVLSLASRVLVIHAGVVRDVPPDRAAVGRAMLGLS